MRKRTSFCQTHSWEPVRVSPPGRAPDLFVEQVHAVWGQGNNKVVPLLIMDVAGPLSDTVSHGRLIDNLSKRETAERITKWVESGVLADRRTMLTIYRQVL